MENELQLFAYKEEQGAFCWPTSPECSSEDEGVCIKVDERWQRFHPAEGMEKGQPPAETTADGQEKSQQEVQRPASLLRSQETPFTLQEWTP